MDRNQLRANPFFNPSTFIENRRINEAAAELSALHDASATTETQVLRLFELDRDQGHEIAKLQAVVYVLMQMLAEKNLLDVKDMDDRIQAAVTKLQQDPAWQRMRGA